MKASTLSLTLVALASIGCQQAIPVEGTASHLVCSLDDCSNWETDLVQEEIADYRLHHVELFNTDFVEPTMIHVDSWLPCDCGGYANGTEIHILGQVGAWVLRIHESRFAHEMTHNNLRRLAGTGDSKHELPGTGDPFAKIKVGQWTGEHTLLVRVMEANGNAGVPLAD